MQLAMERGEEGEARAFYLGVLGMTEIAKPAVLASQVVRGSHRRCRVASRGRGAVSAGSQGAPRVLVDDLDDPVARLQAAGFQIVWDADRPAFDACTSISVMDAAIRASIRHVKESCVDEDVIRGKPSAAAGMLAAALPDVPRWVYVRSLLSAGAEVRLTADRNTALVFDQVSAALVGRREPALLREVLLGDPPGPDLLVQDDAALAARAALPG